MHSFLRSHIRYVAAAAGFSLIINMALLAPSLFMLQVFDRVLSTRSAETLVMLSLVTALALGLMFVLDGLRGRLLALLGGLFERSEGRRVLQRVLDDAPSLDPAQQAYALRDVSVVRAFLSGAGIVALFDAPWMIVYIALVAAFSPLLGALALASCIVLMVLAWVNESGTRKSVEQAQQASRDVGQFVDATLRSPEVVRALGMTPALARRWEARTGAIQTRQLAIQRISGWVGSATRFFRQSVQVVMMGTAAWMVIQQQATAGVMIAVTIILGRALAPVESLIAQWKALVEARSAWRRLRVLDEQHAVKRFAALPDLSGAISVSDVSYAPPGAQQATVRNVSVDVASGEVLAIIGPSGSGKTTLARLMLGVIQPRTGSVSVDGASLSQWDPDRLGRQLGDGASGTAYVQESVQHPTVGPQLAPRIGGAGPAGAGQCTCAQVVAEGTHARVGQFVVDRLERGADGPGGRSVGRAQCVRDACDARLVRSVVEQELTNYVAQVNRPS